MTGDLNNAIVKHMWEKNHRIDTDNANIIREQDTNTRKLIESMIINSTNNI